MRKEVLKYMHKIGFQVSCQYFAILLMLSLLWAVITQDYHSLKLVIPIMIIISIFVHYVVKRMSRRWYSYYELLYDTQKRIDELKEKIGATIR